MCRVSCHRTGAGLAPFYSGPMRWVPVVDLSASGAIDAIRDACERVGFLGVVNHGVAADVLDDVWRTAREFFDLELEKKNAVAMPYAGYPYGYAPMAYESLARSTGATAPADAKESFAIGPVDPPDHAFTDPDEASVWSPNLWPAAPLDMRAVWEAAFREFAALAARLLGRMAEGFGMRPDYFEPLIDRHTSAMRALNYPALGTALMPGQQRAGAHTDYGTLTVLVPDPNVGGLEVERPDGSWEAVPPEPGVLVVNLGDAMARWTNDRWKSTLHRVVPVPERRQSIAFFHNANWDARIECLPMCLGPGESPRYAPMAAGPHLMSKFRSTVAPGANQAD
jgi:isopenicillin N synthase-like dioxygenase